MSVHATTNWCPECDKAYTHECGVEKIEFTVDSLAAALLAANIREYDQQALADAIIKAAKEASEPHASSAGADGTATRPEGQGPTSARNGPKPGGTHIVIGLVPPFDTDDGERP